ncbi:MAG: hypothetical protein QOJ42_3420 [Acidobacteriaceae bacterium]|nr:hypothetical protein [Acidobacteriaceae bacterium]
MDLYLLDSMAEQRLAIWRSTPGERSCGPHPSPNLVLARGLGLTSFGRYYLPHYLRRKQRQVSRNGQVFSFFSFTARPSRFGWPCRKTHKKGVEGRVMRGRLPSRYRPVPSPMASISIRSPISGYANQPPRQYLWHPIYGDSD